MKIKNQLLLTGLAMAGFALTAPTANAALTALVLDLTANGGINPNTGVAWAAGDTYRLAFHTAGTFSSESNNLQDYHDFVTAQAHQNSALAGTTWYAMVMVNLDGTMTQADSPKNNVLESTLTSDLTGGFGIGGAGSPIYAMNGSTAIARNNADIWNGWSNPFDGDNTLRLAAGSTNLNSAGVEVTASQNVFYSPFLDQFGLGDSANIHGRDVMTGFNGVGGGHVNALGNTIEIDPQTVPLNNTHLNHSRGNSNANSVGRVTNRFTDVNTALTSVYAISEVMTVVPEPSTALLGALGLLGLLRRRRG